jgi:hypothetical protein
MRRVLRAFRRFGEAAGAPGSALSLAALRIVVPLLLVVTPEFQNAVLVASWDPARFVVPEGLGWFVRTVPISPGIARTFEVVGFAAALFAVAGLRSRPALGVLSVACFYLYAVSNLAGHVWKDLHLVWFAVLLAASPCDDVLGADARLSPFATGRKYAVTIAFVAALFAVIYVFPGVHKLSRSGLAWALSDNLANQLRWKWLEHDTVPSFRLDQHPWLLEAGGLFVLGFELGSPLLFLVRRLRPLALGMGLAFHLVSELVFTIPFASLWLCYVALVDWRPLVRWIFPNIARGPSDSPTVTGDSAPFGTVVVGALLFAGAAIQGARGQMQSFPFACYPTFEWRAGDRMPDLVVGVVDVDGHEVEISHGRDADGHRTQRRWAELWALAGVTAPVSPARLTSYFRSEVARVAERRVPDARGVRFYRVERSVNPELRGGILSSRLIFELEL